ncbi:MAG TPA: cytochrome c [Dongiaceae bacterium]|nr:cytochrome c [Dongiaceae bacterium]
MRFARVLITILVVILVLAGGGLLLAWKPAIAPIARPDPARFDAALVKRGAQLAAAGDCIACHTTPGGKVFAGGLAVPTPFGTIYSTNITPDEETGIGRWSEAAFIRALRSGVDREGHQLYPAFPYDHFTLVTDDDDRALYAYLMTRQPVRAEAKANDLVFPLGFRPLVAGWKLLYFRQGPFQPDPSKDAAWNRGAYLAEGLAHCGACHTPRNALGAEDRDHPFAGGESEGWVAYAIDGKSPAPLPWDEAALAFYLRHGWHLAHGVARGPMAEVTGNLDGVPDSDIAGIAHYIADRMGPPSPARQARGAGVKAAIVAAGDAGPEQNQAVPAAATEDRGAALYGASCASCHDSRRPLPFGGMNFQLSTAVNAPDPQNIVNVMMYGLPPADGEASAVMPAFGGTLDDDDMVAVLDYLRRTFSTQPAWSGLKKLVADTRSGAHPVTVRPTEGIERSPAHIGAED